MAVTAHVYSKFALSLATKKIDLTADTIKVALFSAYTVGTTQDTAQFFSDITGVGTETSATGYTAGGQALGSVTFTLSGHVYTLDAADPSWTTAGSGSAAFAVIYDSTPGTASTNPLISYMDLGGTQSFPTGTWGITLNAAGIATITGS